MRHQTWDGSERPDTYRANTPLLIAGIIGNLAVLVYTLIDDPESLLWVAGLLALGGVLYLLERFFGKKRLRPDGVPPFAEGIDADSVKPPASAPTDKES